MITPDVVALTFADADGGLFPSWTPGSHIDVQLPSGLDADPTTAHSCRQGSCGTCKLKVISGRINRRGRTAETDGDMLVCAPPVAGW